MSIQGPREGRGTRRKAGETAGGEWARYADESVNRALKWLRENQNADGSWSTHDREAMTGLAALGSPTRASISIVRG